MQPYQQANQELLRQKSAPFKAAGALVGGAAALATKGAFSNFAGSAIASRVLPLLNDYVPEKLALKGLDKIDPRYGKFANAALDYGNSFNTVKEFIADKFSPGSDKNLIQKYSPELFQEISNLIKKGESPIGAGASMIKKYGKIIKQIQNDYKADWLDIVESIFGKGDIAQQGMQQQQMPQQSQQMQQGISGQQIQGQQGGGNGNARLLQAVQSINQRLGGQ